MCTDSSSDEEEFVYEPASRPSRGPSGHYWDQIGHSFVDTEDEMTFEIVDVCKRKGSAGYYFKYIDVQLVGKRDIEDTDHDYTPCGELMSAAWCRWIPNVGGSRK